MFVTLAAVLHLLGDERRPLVAPSLRLQPADSRSEFVFFSFLTRAREATTENFADDFCSDFADAFFFFWGAASNFLIATFRSTFFLATSAAEKQACRARERKKKEREKRRDGGREGGMSF